MLCYQAPYSVVGKPSGPAPSWSTLAAGGETVAGTCRQTVARTCKPSFSPSGVTPFPHR